MIKVVHPPSIVIQQKETGKKIIVYTGYIRGGGYGIVNFKYYFKENGEEWFEPILPNFINEEKMRRLLEVGIAHYEMRNE